MHSSFFTGSSSHTAPLKVVDATGASRSAARKRKRLGEDMVLREVDVVAIAVSNSVLSLEFSETDQSPGVLPILAGNLVLKMVNLVRREKTRRSRKKDTKYLVNLVRQVSENNYFINSHAPSDT